MRAGCVIGFTGDLGEKVIPNIVGVDIGCGMRVLNLGPISGIDYHAFHEHILDSVPSGMRVREENRGFKPLVGGGNGYLPGGKAACRRTLLLP